MARPISGARWREKSKTFERRVDAERFLTSIEPSKLSGLYVDPDAGRVTFAEYVQRWSASRVHRATTTARVESDLRVHLLPAFGSRPIGSIGHSDVQGWVRSRCQLLSPGSVDNVYRTLSSIFRSAVRDRVVAVSPCEGVVLPKRMHTEVIPPTVEEVGVLL
ncbi:MAG: N-terminal phage integrase SAM-like domain-containing protein [Actinomycetota bacterium]|nr:N-terminal phage integrase SAM-like domain-containing protein [Actinomycetota bacterium]